MTYTMNGDYSITIPEERFKLVDGEGEVLWEGSTEEFAALMDGMRWEEDGIHRDSPSHRRLVSRWYRIEG